MYKQYLLRIVSIAAPWLVVFAITSCQSSSAPSIPKVGERIVDTLNRDKKLPKLVGNYVREFNDLHDLHWQAAQKWGISPIVERSDTANYKIGEELIRIASHTELFRVASLSHSIPYLVPQAARLLSIIASDFRDSLLSKELPVYRLVVTSVTRTASDVQQLMKSNKNAIATSVHCYGTTFDISWKRYDHLASASQELKEVSPDRLKFILGQVLYNLRNRGLCYVKYERKQACYHITAR